MATINQSVGKNGQNNSADVQVVQKLLNQVRHLTLPLPTVREDGVVDDATIKAIETFQRRVVLLNPPDGRVDPNGNTLAKLDENAKAGAIPMIPLFPLKQRPTLAYKEPGAGGRQFTAGRDGGRLHAACDLIAPEGSEVLAMDDGEVILPPYDFYAGTVAIEIDHGNYVARYGELSQSSRSVAGLMIAGMKVKRGQVIGLVGKLSTSGASMLHLELYSGSQSGNLTIRENLPFQRRSDLLDPTDFVDMATFDVTQPPSFDGEGIGKVSSRVSTILNLRKLPASASDSLGQLSPGTTLKILGLEKGSEYDANGLTRDDWFKVESAGKKGYVAAFYVDLEFQTGRANSKVQTQLNLREEPSTSSAIIVSLSPGTTFKVLDRVVASSYVAEGTTRNDWFKIEYNGKRGFVAAFYIDLVEDSNNDLNSILFTHVPKGASDRTANQDDLPARGIRGVKASETMAETDQGRVMQHKAKFKAAGEQFNLPPALLAAIASRESRGGNVLDSNGLGDGGNAFGIMQVDKRFHRVVTLGGIASQGHIDQAAEILRDKLDGVERAFPSLSDSAQLQTAASQYNGGRGLPAPNSDEGTTGEDYMNDIWARARYYASQESWS